MLVVLNVITESSIFLVNDNGAVCPYFFSAFRAHTKWKDTGNAVEES